MSYCRFSSDNWKSNVYVYEGDCWVIHVAGTRRRRQPIRELPLARMPMFGARYNEQTRKVDYPNWLCRLAHRATIGLWQMSHRIHMWDLRRIERVPIDLPYAGETIFADTPRDCFMSLMELKGLGYHVPDVAIDLLLDEPW